MQKKFDSQFGAYRTPAPRSRMKPVVLLGLVLWFLLWSGYNTGIYVVLAPDFPATHMQLVHGIRAFFPIIAGWIALLVILARRGLKTQAVAGPLGLMGLFAAVGMVSSALLSRAALQAFYWGAMYESIVVVLVAICSDPYAMESLSQVIKLNWVIDIIIMVGLLAAIPSFGGAALVQTHGSPLGVMAYNGNVGAHGTIAGMASTRNTGFARYAGVAGVVALARLWQREKWNRILWAVILAISLVVLVMAQARTETISFLAASMIVLLLRKRRRVILMGFGTLGAILLALEGFFRGLWDFGTRNGHFDPTLTGRSAQWVQGLEAVRQSPWVGLGFQADRYYLHGIQIENAVFHALIQTGILGTLAYVAAYAVAWIMLIQLYVSRSSTALPDEIPGILMFFTVFSVTESVAYYSAAFLLLAPVLAYIQMAAWQEKAIRAKASYRRREAIQVARAGYAMERRNAGTPERLGSAEYGPELRAAGFRTAGIGFNGSKG